MSVVIGLMVVCGVIGILYFIIRGLISAIRKTGKFKKNLMYSGICLAVIIIAAIISPSTGNNKNAKELEAAAPTTVVKDASTTVKETKPVKTSKPSPTPIQLLKYGVSSDVNIEVIDFKSSNTVGDNEFSKKDAQGVFKVIGLAVTNNQKDAILIDSNSFILLDDQDRQFSYSSDAQLALMSSVGDKDESFFLKKLNPGLSITGHIIFDVPKDAKGFKLQARGGMTGKKINLKVE